MNQFTVQVLLNGNQSIGTITFQDEMIVINTGTMVYNVRYDGISDFFYNDDGIVIKSDNYQFELLTSEVDSIRPILDDKLALKTVSSYVPSVNTNTSASTEPFSPSIDDKIFIINTCNELYKSSIEIYHSVFDPIKDEEEMEEKDQDQDDLEEVGAKLQKHTSRFILGNDFGVVYDFGVICLLPQTFFIINIPLFKKYTNDNFSNINIAKSDYFWDNLSVKYLEKYKAEDYDLLGIYDHYKSVCDNLPECPSTYSLIEKMIDSICDKYNQFMGLGENGLSIKRGIQQEEQRKEEEKIEEQQSIQKENRSNSISNIVVPGILIAPLLTMLVAGESGFAFWLLLGDIIWLIVGITKKGNSCKKCGKWNSYVIIDEEILDSYVTTEYHMRNINGRYEEIPETVTKEVVGITYQCSHCGNTKYEKIERNR